MGLSKAIKEYYANRKIRNNNRQIVSDAIDNKISDLVVKHGPFKGMLYPSKRSAGSALFPKLLGSYEAELHGVIGQAIAKRYTEVIDIGCAEGYYAVGLALRIPNANIYAYDTNPKALIYSNEMFKLNNIEPNRFFTGGFCDEQTLRDIPIRQKALIVCDCEGYEKHLFTKKSLDFLSKQDLLIEVHDLFDIEISSYLSRLFSETHRLTVVYSIDDIQKAKTYNYDEIDGYDLSTKKVLLAEGRGSIMEWFYLESIN